MPAKSSPERTRGMLIACGDLPSDPRATQLMARMLGMLSPAPRVLLIRANEPIDSDESHTEQVLHAVGGINLHCVTLQARSDAEQPALLDAIESADLVVLEAELPLRLSTLIGGTALARLLRRRNADGMAICGVAAGAALLCEHMLASGGSGPTPRLGGASLAPGLGLTNRVVIDHGGHSSDRLGRLLAALALNPFALGLGIDNATMAIIGDDNVLDVIGHGGITVIDPAEMADSNVADLDPGAPIRITNLRLHALTAGTRYDLDFRRTVG